MSDDSLLPIPDKATELDDKPREVRNLTEARQAGLTDRDGRFLYHVVKLQLKTNWSAISQAEIYNSGQEARELAASNDLSKGLIGQIGSDLQWLKWDQEERAYLETGRTKDGTHGYRTTIASCITLPRTAKVAVELQKWDRYRPGYEGQISENDFIEYFSRKFQILDGTIKADLRYLLKHHYLYPYDQESVHFRPAERLQMEMAYLARLEKLFSKGADDVRPFSSTVDFTRDSEAGLWDDKGQLRIDKMKMPFPSLEPSVAKVLYAISLDEFYGKNQYLTFESIKDIINDQRTMDLDATGVSVAEVEKSINFLLNNYPVKVLEVRGNTYRRLLQTATGWPCSAYILKTLLELGRLPSYKSLKERIISQHYRDGN